MRLSRFCLGSSAILLLAACANDFDTSRSIPDRGTVGEELYGVLCDRVGAQALHEDLTGASFKGICHKDLVTHAYTDHVDQTALPQASPTAVDDQGHPVSVDAQTTNRAHAVNRIEALARRRGDLIASLDATFPDIKVAVKDIHNSDAAKSCLPPSGPGERKLSDELSDLLGRFQDLYNDGTIPQSTESLARVFDAIKASPDAQSALAQFSSRQGYRPLGVTLGAARPIVAYPGLRDLVNTVVAQLSSDSQPYLFKDGKHQIVPGPSYPQFQKMIDVAHHEMFYAKADPTPAPLKTLAVDNSVGNRLVLNRARTDLEVLQTLFYAQDNAFGAGNPQPIVKRDSHGFAKVALVNNAVPLPFIDKNGDGEADTDALGRFVTADGLPPPTPFLAPDGPSTGARDNCGRLKRDGAIGGGSSDGGSADGGASQSITDQLCGANDSSLTYEYIDTAHVFAGSLIHDLKPLTNPDPAANHETLMYALAGAHNLFGQRDGSAATQRCYLTDATDPTKCADPASIISYDAFHPESSPLVDLVYALGQIMGDPTVDDTLVYAEQLFQKHEGDVARLAGDGLAMKNNANADTEAKLPAKSVFWDEMIDTTIKIEQEPGLLEDVLRALGDDRTQQLGTIFSNYMSFNDRITYDHKNLNGKAFNATLNAVGDMATPVDRTKPDTGFNRSAFQRFLSLIHDTNGVTACNKDQAVVHAQGIPLLGKADICNGNLCSLGASKFKECEVFKIDNLAKFYLQSIIGKANMYFRPSILRNGILGIGAASIDVIEQSSGIGLNANDFDGFWDKDTSSKVFRPRPQWLNRLVFFDVKNDATPPTQNFLNGLQSIDIDNDLQKLPDISNIGTAVCPERIIDDPVPDAPDASPDKKVHGLRTCDPTKGQYLAQRGADTIFVWEQFGFYDSITPLLTAFANHDREDLFIELMEDIYAHWADDKGTDQECLISQDPNAKYKTCSKDGLVSYEPLLTKQFAGDFLPALHDLEKTLSTTSVAHCTALDTTVDPATNKPKNTCSATSALDGIGVLAAATRALLDPVTAKNAGLVDRTGKPTTARNDGTTNAQVTPIYLLLNALNGMDAAFANDPDRLAQWRLARSQLVDQFLGVTGTGPGSTFTNVSVPKIVPTVIDMTRAQLFSHCPQSFTPPYPRCDWARDQLTTLLSNVVRGPTFSASLDLLEAVRKDDNARRQVGLLVQYLLDSASKNDALPAALASTNDILQLLQDDTNLVPLYHVLAKSLERSQVDASGNITQKSVLDAQLALLGRVAGRAGTSGVESCKDELDPNQVLTIALGNLVTPMTAANGQQELTPLQVIMDVIGDVNRDAPEKTDKLLPADYASIADNVSDFMLNKERGLEQFYEIVRQGTSKE